MEQEVFGLAEMLAACFKSAPVTLTVLSQVNAYNRTRSGHCIWADDLPPGGYKTLLRAMKFSLSKQQWKAFMEKVTIKQQ